MFKVVWQAVCKSSNTRTYPHVFKYIHTYRCKTVTPSLRHCLLSTRRIHFASILTEQQINIVQKERSALLDLIKYLKDVDANESDVEVIRDALLRLDDVYMLVVVGEFNAGKSTFLNALLGDKYLKEGVLPTTAKICVIRNGDVTSRAPVDDDVAKKLAYEDQDDVEVKYVPVEWLKLVALVDTPGTNAIITRHEKLTQHIVPRSDFVIFVTSADRPFSESERQFLSSISEWGKKVVLVVNKMDMLTVTDRDTVISFVRDQGTRLLGTPPPVFGVSARMALSAKLSNSGSSEGLQDSRQWVSSSFQELETYLHTHLRKDELVRSKLTVPVTVAETVVANTIKTLERRKDVVASDSATLKLIEENMAGFIQDMDRDVEYQRAQLEKALDTVLKRAEAFLNDNVSIFSPWSLLNAPKFREAFHVEVLADLTSMIDDIIGDVSELIHRKASSQSKAVHEYVEGRQWNFTSKMVGSVRDVKFDAVRYTLLERLKSGVDKAVLVFEPSYESEKMAEAMKQSIMQSAVIEIGAASVGTLVAAHVFDVTGVLAASSLAVVGLLVLPYQRRRHLQLFTVKVNNLRAKLDQVLVTHVSRETRAVHDTILDSVAPYTRFVKLEEERIMSSTHRLKEVQSQLRAIKHSVG